MKVTPILFIILLLTIPFSNAQDDRLSFAPSKKTNVKKSTVEALEESINAEPFCKNSIKKYSCRDLYEQNQKFKLDAVWIDGLAKEILDEAKRIDPQVTPETIKELINRQFDEGQYCMKSSLLSQKEFKKRTLALFQVDTENQKKGWKVVSRKGRVKTSTDRSGNVSVESIYGNFCENRATYSCEMMHKQAQIELQAEAIQGKMLGEGYFINQLMADFKQKKADKLDALINSEKDYTTEINFKTMKSDYLKWLKKIVNEVKEKDPTCKSECANDKNPEICYKMIVGKKIQRRFDDGTFCDGKLWSPREMKEYILTH